MASGCLSNVGMIDELSAHEEVACVVLSRWLTNLTWCQYGMGATHQLLDGKSETSVSEFQSGWLLLVGHFFIFLCLSPIQEIDRSVEFKATDVLRRRASGSPLGETIV